MAAECGPTKPTCVDLRGQVVELQLADAEACHTSSIAACRELSLPDRLVLRIVDERVHRRDLQCETHRAEIVSGDLGDLELLGPADATFEVANASFALAESVRVGSSDCYGRLFVAAGLVGEGSSQPEHWLGASSDSPRWSIAFSFVPDDPSACAEIAKECSSANCFGDVIAP